MIEPEIVVKANRVQIQRATDEGWIDIGEIGSGQYFTPEVDWSPGWDEAFSGQTPTTYSATYTLEHVDPQLLALLAGQWITGLSVSDDAAKGELLWRVNQRLRGIDPGKPVNWKGIEDE